MPSASSWIAARTRSETLRLWPRWMTSAPVPWIRRRITLIAASWPSNSEAAVTKRSGGTLSSKPVSPLPAPRAEVSALTSGQLLVELRRK